MQRKSSRAPPKQWPPPAQEDEEVEDTKNPPQEGAKLAAETRVVKPVPISPRDAKPSLEKLKERANAGDINSAFIVGRMLAVSFLSQVSCFIGWCSAMDRLKCTNTDPNRMAMESVRRMTMRLFST